MSDNDQLGFGRDGTKSVVRDEAVRFLRERQNRIPRIPEGCDQQGRHPEASPISNDLEAAQGIFWGVLAGLTIWSAIIFAILTFFWGLMPWVK